MQVTITSGGIVALCTVLALMGGVGMFVIKSIVAGEIRKLNGRYVYAQGSKLTGHEIETRMLGMEKAIFAKGLRP